MKQKLFSLIFLMSCTFMMSQNNSFWQKTTFNNSSIKSSKLDLPRNQSYKLNIDALNQALKNTPKRAEFSGTSDIIISFPNANGEFERYAIMEASVMHPDLAERYPNIKSYAGQGIDDPTAIIRFSISPLGLQSMRLSANMPASFIEPYTNDGKGYTVFNRDDKIKPLNDFECLVTETVSKKISEENLNLRNANDATLRTYRLAMSATGEFTTYHGGTKALALAAMNNTMTRVNGIFETDFNITMVLIANTDAVIYTNSGSDPYGNTTSNYNNELQSTLTSVIGESNYDVGHLVANLQNNGNAGCIGCVCVDGQKGSGWTSHTVPEGDFFDVDYVSHEFGHQFGGRHTFTHSSEGSGIAQVEPGSGSTIMSYAGITGATDVQSNVDPYFHAISIQQITDYAKSTSCQTNTSTGNAVPTADAGLNYTIPKGTPFVLTGSGSDTDANDVLTYGWEQMDENNASTTYPSVTATTGVAFRSYNPTTDTKRYFPRLPTIKTGATSWQWEAVPNVGRTLNFRFTVKDNVAGGANNNSDDMVVTVNGTAGPFVVNTPNTNVIWNAGTTQTVAWDVAGTTGNGINVANVDIFLSTDGGDTYPIALAANVSNDGSQDIVVPNNVGTQNRVMVKGSNNIFFDISNTNFSIEGQVVCNATVPTSLVASSIGPDSATLSWDAVPGASYDLEYRQVGSSTWTTLSVNGISSVLSGLSSLTQYETQVRSKCPDNATSAYSSLVNFTTTDVQLNYCSSASTNINDEFIGRVQLNTIDNASGGQFYTDFTSVSTTLTKDTQYTITVTPTWTGTVYPEAYSVWIDYNRDGDFSDAGEQVWSQAATTTTPVSGTFTIPTSAVENATRMRVSMKYNGIPTECETFTYGEVEDYTVIIEGNGPDTIAPVITLVGASTINLNVGDTYTEQGATATDNIDGDITANIVTTGTVNTSVGGTYLVDYNVSDAAGNAATQVTRTVNVIPDTTAPIITLLGASTINLNVGDTYTEQGATATDNIDGDITANIITTGTVNTSVGGTYLVNYNVSDSVGNAATQVTRTVNVIPDTTAPVITLVGASTINLNIGGTYTEQGATATDNIDGDITANIITTGTVNTSLGGTYLVNYNVSDAAGNAATQVTRTVIVASDTTAPVITLNGSASIGLELGTAYTEQGATATDNVDGDISANIVIGGDTVNSNAAGTYIITYNVSDSAGNAATQVTRTVTVNPDSTVPVISLIGASTINLNVGDTYTEQGATASDNYDGDITANIITTGSVNTAIASTYLVNYNVSDAAGNAATQVTRTINVTEVSTGCTGGISTYPYSEGFENTLGVWTQSSADDINWTVDANGTPSSNTGPASASQGSYYIYVEASGNGTGYPNKRAILNSPCFDLSGLSTPALSFDYHMYGATDMGTIDLELSSDNGATWTSIWSKSGNQGNSWFTVNLDLSTYIGGNIQVRFNRLVGSTWQADIAIDNFNISEPVAPTCSDGIQNGDETGVDCGGTFCIPCSTSDVVLNQGFFETGWDGWIDGGSDVARVSSTNSYEGSYSIRIRDNSGTSSAMTLSNIDVSPYSQVVIDFYFYVYSMENNEDFWLRFYDGSTWATVATWTRGVDINNNTFYNGTITLTPAQYNFAVNSGFRFQCDASGNNDQIFIDQVTITGTNSGRGDVNQLVKIKTILPSENPDGNLKIYPNPVKGNVLNVDVLETETFTYVIKNMLGQVISKGISEGKVNIGQLNAGMYFIEVNDGEDIMTKKFIRQ